MSLNDTPRSERVHIGFFGRTNAGKSSLINAVTGQDLSVVSAIEGTTTDPVYKAMELLPLGPVVVIDTPGLDDESELGSKRIQKARQVMNKSDLALLVVDGGVGLTESDLKLQSLLKEKEIPFLTVMTKADLSSAGEGKMADNTIWVSTKTGENIHELKERMTKMLPENESRPLMSDLISSFDLVMLVIPIDKAAPKGRLILPQQQVIRDILDNNATAIVTQDDRLRETLQKLDGKPRLVITDSQVFAKVAADTPDDIPLTSFSILFARYKGDLETTVHGALTLKDIEDGDRILISEGCTHHRQCDDIGTVKLPRMIEGFTGKKPEYVLSSGTEFPEDLRSFKLIVHCGGCMVNAREMRYRLAQARDQGVPFTNYGILIAHTQGILERSIAIFDDISTITE